MTDHDDALSTLHDHLAATAELPVERSASRWLGEAEAVAADLADADLPGDVVEDRLGTVAHLLDEVKGTGHAEADEHVASAQRLVAELRE